MRSIGFFITAMLLCPLFPSRKTMEGGNTFNSKKNSLVHFKIPLADFSSSFTSGKKNNNVDTNQLKQSSWYADAINGIHEAEYEIKPAEDGNAFASPNRQQNLRASYTADKFTLEPREKDNWKLQLTLKGVYSGKKKIYSPAKEAVAVTEKNKIQYNHNDEFTVEYINSKEGVRQNFIIQKEPAGNPSFLSIKLQTNSGWFVNKVHSKEIHFAKPNGTAVDKKLTYNDLKVWDANHKELPAHFETKQNEIEIIADVKNAVYPVTIDPLSTTPVTTLSGISANDNFGISVASAGDVNGDGYSDVIIGAFGVSSNKGAAYVFNGSNTGLSVSPATTLNGINTSDNFGYSVASAGDVNGDGYSDVVVGAFGVLANKGAAYVFTGSNTGLSVSPATTLNGIGTNDNFGVSVACAGDVNGDGYSDVVAGAYGVLSNKGAAYVFMGSNSGLSASPATTLNGISTGDYLGVSVASAGDVNGDGYSDVVAGAYGVSSNKGAAYIFIGSNTGLLASPATTLNGISTGDQLGYSVASAGDVNGDGYSDVVAGAYGVSSNKGAAYIFSGSSTGLSASPAITLNGISTSDNFGYSVASIGDINGDGYSDVVASAYVVSSNKGAAYIFSGSSTGLSASPAITLNGIIANGQFGYSLASAGDINGDGYSDLIIGANNVSSSAGAAYTYHGSPDGLSITPIISNPPVSQVESGFGNCVSSAGDVNSDGYSDVLISAITYDGSHTDEGRVFVYYGSATGLSATPDLILDDANQNGANFGYACAGVGDVNGDGHGDVVIGAIFYDGGHVDEGRAYLYYGHGGTGLSPTYDLFFDYTNQNGAGFGNFVAGVGDVNGDGYGDIVIGAYGYDDLSNTNEGLAYVHYGSSTGPSATPNRILNDANQVNSYFGACVAGAGDINGDGIADVIVGASNYNGQGVAFVYYGHQSSGLSATPDRILNDATQAGENYGGRLAAAGDVNGDGYGDVIIGAFFYNGEKGRAYMYYGSSGGLSLTPFILENSQAGNLPGDRMGYSVASGGDVNGDGYSDVIVGVPQYDNGAFNEQGRVYVYYGRPAGIAAVPDRILNDANQSAEFFGVSVSSAGDINGDGYSDVIIGADHGSFPTVGRAFVYYGNNNGGLRNNLRLYNSDLTTPIQQFNMTEPNLFGAGLFAKSFMGVQKGKLTWQTVRNGNPFPGSPITNNTTYTAQDPVYTSLGLTGTELKHQIAKVIPAKATYIRARVKYDPVTAITGQVYGPWRYPEGFLRGRRDIGSVALPVKFVSFTAVKQNETVLLKWITTDETSGINYEVQHSTDGINFTVIKTIPAQNSSRSEYEWLHADPAKGKNYYRIRAIENGSNTFTATRQVAFQSAGIIKLYPNPVKSGETLTIEAASNNLSGNIIVEISDMSGQKKKQYLFSSLNTTTVIPLPALPTGQYILKMINGKNLLYAERFLVIK